MRRLRPQQIALDFDGTVVKHAYPAIGESIGAQYWLHKLVNAGHFLMLNTMRSGLELKQAVSWFHDYDIPLYGVNINPTQREWTSSPKVHADLYIDDRGLGIPLTQDPGEELPYVDWALVGPILGRKGLL